MAEFVVVWYLQRIYLSVLILIDHCSVWDYYSINLRIIINNMIQTFLCMCPGTNEYKFLLDIKLGVRFLLEL